MSDSLETFERQDFPGSCLPFLSADSGCWQVQWPLRPGDAGRRAPSGGATGALGPVRKLLAMGPRASLPVRPGEAR